jgi:hypothetical protein
MFPRLIAIVKATLDDGFSPLNFVWSTGFIGDTISNLPAGPYQVYASDRFNVPTQSA